MCQQTLRPFVEEIIGVRRVTLEGQHQTQLFAEPLQCLITIDCDCCRYNVMRVNLVEAVAHQTNCIVLEEQVDCVTTCRYTNLLVHRER